MRKAISKKLRFSVFERDNFTCQYCGRTPENDDVTLQVDHIVSVKNGGENDFGNLLTSCFDCNIGKGARTTIKAKQTPEAIKKELARTKERMEQVLAMNVARRKIGNLKKKIKQESLLWIKESMSGGYNEKLYEELQKTIDRSFKTAPTDKILEALSIVEDKHHINGFKDINSFVSYFYGVLRNCLLTQEEQDLMYFWRSVFSKHNTKMFDTVRLFLLSKSYLPQEFHLRAIETVEDEVQRHRGETFSLSPDVSVALGAKTFQMYSSGVGFNYFVCEALQWEEDIFNEEISKSLEEK